jgi:hypothetical protein
MTNNYSKLCVFVVAYLMTFWCGCRDQRVHPKPYSRAHLEAVLKTGVSKGAVLKEFGPPMARTDHDKDSELWTYHSRASVADLKPQSEVIAFQVVFTNDAVLSWSAALTERDAN